MCHLLCQHILLGLTVMLLNSGGIHPLDICQNGNSSSEDFSTVETIVILNSNDVIGLTVVFFLILLSLVCQWITCVVIMVRKAVHTAPVPRKKDKECTKVAGEEELWYATVKFTGVAKDSDHVTPFDPKTEYSTVVFKTPDTSTSQPDSVVNVEESNPISIEE
ncbi:uncharacterized protein Hap1MRO34_021880 [Clarias gariepinus]